MSEKHKPLSAAEIIERIDRCFVLHNSGDPLDSSPGKIPAGAYRVMLDAKRFLAGQRQHSEKCDPELAREGWQATDAEVREAVEVFEALPHRLHAIGPAYFAALHRAKATLLSHTRAEAERDTYRDATETWKGVARNAESALLSEQQAHQQTTRVMAEQIKALEAHVEELEAETVAQQTALEHDGNITEAQRLEIDGLELALSLTKDRATRAEAALAKAKEELAGYSSAICYETGCVNCGKQLDALVKSEAERDEAMVRVEKLEWLREVEPFWKSFPRTHTEDGRGSTKRWIKALYEIKHTYYAALAECGN